MKKILLISALFCFLVAPVSQAEKTEHRKGGTTMASQPEGTSTQVEENKGNKRLDRLTSKLTKKMEKRSAKNGEVSAPLIIIILLIALLLVLLGTDLVAVLLFALLIILIYLLLQYMGVV